MRLTELFCLVLFSVFYEQIGKLVATDRINFFLMVIQVKGEPIFDKRINLKMLLKLLFDFLVFFHDCIERTFERHKDESDLIDIAGLEVAAQESRVLTLPDHHGAEAVTHQPHHRVSVFQLSTYLLSQPDVDRVLVAAAEHIEHEVLWRRFALDVWFDRKEIAEVRQRADRSEL